MTIRESLAISTAVCTLLLSGLANAELRFTVEVKKKVFLYGEPILLRTTFENLGPSENLPDSIGWTHRFSMKIAKDDGEFYNVISHKPFNVSQPPVWFEFFSDRYALYGDFPIGHNAVRIDMIVVDPGSYKMKAILRDPRTRLEKQCSNEVCFDVLPLVEGGDSITKYIGPDDIWEFGSKICRSHYLYGGSSMILGKAKQGRFEDVADGIIRECTDSPFREWAMYMSVISVGSEGDGVARAKVKAMAEQFMVEYPESWLLPEVTRVLVYTALDEKDLGRANSLVDDLEAVEPDSILIGRLRSNIEGWKSYPEHLKAAQKTRSVTPPMEIPPKNEPVPKE